MLCSLFASYVFYCALFYFTRAIFSLIFVDIIYFSFDILFFSLQIHHSEYLHSFQLFPNFSLMDSQWWFLTFQSYFWKWCWKLNWNFVHRSDFCQQVDLTFDPLGWQLPFLMVKTAHYYLYWRLFLFWKIFTQEKNSYCFFEHLNPLGLSWGRLKFHTSLCA